ncbi:MAG: D-aminoacyl-tRNA deacylase [Acidimicrobiia bacterium]|nr:D-aminoacyl-tRNA deacylase [Acidimicrobiia bacterium]MDH5420212.1 D-aminoacyl-tRNA deacylase [Acidimicrobiia bacterium]MDH5504489.1 D-aminoacyl-tRNA deacylase [Acidimicrobiia bacterium]
MRLVVQRVKRASVAVGDRIVGSISPGLLVLAGTTHGDSEADADVLADKLVALRVFSDAEGKMNRSLLDTGGELLVVSQFTLYGSTRKGNRPSFTNAGDPAVAGELIDRLAERVSGHGVRVASGEFGAAMEVELLNDGPVTLILETIDGKLV